MRREAKICVNNEEVETCVNNEDDETVLAVSKNDESFFY